MDRQKEEIIRSYEGLSSLCAHEALRFARQGNADGAFVMLEQMWFYKHAAYLASIVPVTEDGTYIL